MNIPDWYNLKEDYIVVHPQHKPNMGEVETLTNVRYLDFIEQDKIIFMRKQDGINFTKYSPYTKQEDGKALDLYREAFNKFKGDQKAVEEIGK